MIPIPRCPACDGPLESPFTVQAGARAMSVLSCTRCGSAVKSPFFDDDELRDLYAHYDHHERHFVPGPGEIDNLVVKVKRIERFLPSKGRLLEVGCGRGWLLSQALQRGWDAEGVELAGSAGDHLLPELRGRVRFIASGRDFDALEPASFDAVCSYQVLEHLTRPAAAVRSWVRALKPGGVLVLDTPNAGGWGARRYRERWVHHAREDHFVLFTKKALEHLARENGVAPLRFTYGGSPAVFTGASRDGSPGAAPARRLFRHRTLTRLLRPIVHRLGLGDNIELIGRKSAHNSAAAPSKQL